MVEVKLTTSSLILCIHRSGHSSAKKIQTWKNNLEVALNVRLNQKVTSFMLIETEEILFLNLFLLLFVADMCSSSLKITS